MESPETLLLQNSVRESAELPYRISSNDATRQDNWGYLPTTKTFWWLIRLTGLPSPVSGEEHPLKVFTTDSIAMGMGHQDCQPPQQAALEHAAFLFCPAKHPKPSAVIIWFPLPALGWSPSWIRGKTSQLFR